MKKIVNITNHKDLRNYLNQLNIEMRTTAVQLQADSKALLFHLPEKLVQKGSPSLYKAQQLSNPIGKFLAKQAKSSLLRKQGFVTKLVVGLLIKKIGQKLAQQWFNTGPTKPTAVPHKIA